MAENAIFYIQTIIGEYGAIGVFIASLLEQIIAPIPSSLIPILAGALFLPTYETVVEIVLRTVFIIAVPTTAGIIIGASIVYCIGYYGGKAIINKTKKWLGIKWENITKIKEKLNKSRNKGLALFVVWLLPIFPGVAVSAFCGIAHYPFLKFIVIIAYASFLRAITMAVVGWQTGELYLKHIDFITKIGNYILIASIVLLIIGIIIYFIYKQYKKNSNKISKNNKKHKD